MSKSNKPADTNTTESTAEELAQLELEKATAERIAAEKSAAAAAEQAAAAAALEAEEKKTRIAEAIAKDEATRAQAGVSYYKAVFGGPMIDPDTNKVFTGDKATKSAMTGWLQSQIKAGKIEEDRDE